MKHTLRLLLGIVLSLWLAAGNSWASGHTAPNGYQTFVDTSGQLTLNDILSNRYTHLFVPSASSELKLAGAGTALWVNVSLEHTTTYLLELHNPSISRINVYLMQDEMLRASYSTARADARSSIPLPTGATRSRSTSPISKASAYWSGCRTTTRSPLT